MSKKQLSKKEIVDNIATFCIILIFAIIAAAIIYFIGEHWFDHKNSAMHIIATVCGAIVFACIGALFAPVFIRIGEKFINGLLSDLFRIPMSTILPSTIGLIFGLVIGSLVGARFEAFAFVGPYIALFCTLFLGYIGLIFGYKKKDEFYSLFSFPKKEKTNKGEPVVKSSPNKVLDTSVIIDGRIADICKTGFLEGTLVIPGFVLEELQHIADSADALKRNRGRRGLDILNKLRKEFESKVIIMEKDYPDISEVDSKLVRMAKDLKGVVVTNDFNLNKVAQFQGVEVFNINDLANAIKPVLLPGEEMLVKVLKEGKDPIQGVGYLDDGTMIVVENGRRYLGQTIRVTVTSVLQTSAGRMIFARAGDHVEIINEMEYEI